MADHLSMVTEFGFDDYWEVPALVLLWHSNILTVTRKKPTPQEMHAMIQVLPNNFSWCSPRFMLVLFILIVLIYGIT